MARRPNYGFEKRQKELKRQQKKDEKAAKKAASREAANTPDTESRPDEAPAQE